MNNAHILVVEDDDNLRFTLVDNLEMEDYQVSSAENLSTAKKLCLEQSMDLCILDIMLPDGDGNDFCTWLRQHQPDTRVIMLTARTLDSDLNRGFQVGADDYVTKPYRMQEVLFRIQALLKRKINTSVDSESTVDIINGFSVDWLAKKITLNGQEIHLTQKAFAILEFLYEHMNKAKSRDDILDGVWGKDVFVDNRTIDNFISNLRKQLKLQGDSEFVIASVRGVGYRLEVREDN